MTPGWALCRSILLLLRGWVIRRRGGSGLGCSTMVTLLLREAVLRDEAVLREAVLPRRALSEKPRVKLLVTEMLDPKLFLGQKCLLQPSNL